MRETTHSRFAVDNSSILYLSLMRPAHCNSYRFSMELTEEICPMTLQKAVDRIYRRFPTVIAGFQPGFFQYYQVPAQQPPQVQPDPGCLRTMTAAQIRSCAFRVFYQDRAIIIEAFHALADGYGAIACFTTLVAEYLRLMHGIHIPVQDPLRDADSAPMAQELEDAYLKHAKGKPLHLPSRYACQLPGRGCPMDTVYRDTLKLPARSLLDAARRHGVSVTALLSAAMASAIMELQLEQKGSKPVRIMVPVDLRRMFPSGTLRNFILYVLPTLEIEDASTSLPALAERFSAQMREQLDKDRLASIMAYNVRTQQSWYFKLLPLSLKLAVMRLAYRYFGESNSSLTLTNLGALRLPMEMQPYVKGIEVTLTPRARSPYNCAAISCGGETVIQLSRFVTESTLVQRFRRNLDILLAGEEQ